MGKHGRKGSDVRSTYSSAYGTAPSRAVIQGSAPEPVSAPLRQLGELLGLFAEGDPFLWSSTTQFGAAGYVTVTYNLDPSELHPDVRHGLLSIAAQLANWHHTT